MNEIPQNTYAQIVGWCERYGQWAAQWVKHGIEKNPRNPYKRKDFKAAWQRGFDDEMKRSEGA